MLNIDLIDEISEYQTESLTQWDTDQTLKISGATYETTPAIHFANKKSTKALVVTPVLASRVLTVDIPNSLLRQPYPIIAYIYAYDNDTGFTDLIITIPVLTRVQPDDYIFTSDKGLLTLAAINSKIDTLISESTIKVNSLITTKTQELDDLKTTKSDELDALGNQLREEQEDFKAEINVSVIHDNLLINGDFKINQRGGTVYPNTNAWKYSVDRWRYIGLTVTVNDDKTVTLAKENNSDASYFSQVLENSFSNECMLSFEITSLTGTLAVYLQGGDGGIQTYTEPGVYSIQSTQGAKSVVFRLDGETTSVTLKWAKLEYGSIVTPFFSRPYTEELRLCHYFCQVYDGTHIYTLADTNMTYFGFTFVDPIRNGATLTKKKLLDSSGIEVDREIVSYNLNETTLSNVIFDATIGTNNAYFSCVIDAEIYD